MKKGRKWIMSKAIPGKDEAKEAWKIEEKKIKTKKEKNIKNCFVTRISTITLYKSYVYVRIYISCRGDFFNDRK